MNDQLLKAHRHFQEGRLQQARSACREVLKGEPDRPDALQLMGIVYHRMGQPDRAVDYLRRAIARNPGVADFHCNLALALTAQEDVDGAIQAYRAALDLQPDFAEAYFNLGILLREQGDLAQAVQAYRAALQSKPDFAPAHNSLGNALRDQGELHAAEQEIQRALALDPSSWSAHYNLASLHAGLRKTAPAIQGLLRAIAINPRFAAAHAELAELYFRQDHFLDAVACARTAIRLAPTNPHYWQALMRFLRPADIRGDDADLRHELMQYLSLDGIGDQGGVQLLTTFVKRTESFQRLVALADRPADPQSLSLGIEAAGDPFMQRFTSGRIIRDAALERVFTWLRRTLLLHTVSADTETALGEQGLSVAAAIAHQCFMNEYVWRQDKEEARAVGLLVTMLERAAQAAEKIPREWIVVLAAYAPLTKIAVVGELLEKGQLDTDPPIAGLVQLQIVEPLRETVIRSGIQSLTGINDKVSGAVREQYEESPYPRWIDTPATEPRPLVRVLQGLFPFLQMEDFSCNQPPEVLVAGCGTGQNPIHTARRFLDARVLAIDLSLSSLAYGIRKATELGVQNIEFCQADILELESCDRKFDVIECVGVLHHLQDPVTGWRILTNLLRTGGFMKIGLYSELARRPIVAARQLIKQQGYGTSADDIRRFRQVIYDLPDGDLAKDVANFGDFYTLSTCRDLLFHVQEHRFTLPEIDVRLRELGLEFLGFEFSNPLFSKKYKESNPEDLHAVSLSAWHAFETANPLTFRGMYQFWLRKP